MKLKIGDGQRGFPMVKTYQIQRLLTIGISQGNKISPRFFGDLLCDRRSQWQSLERRSSDVWLLLHVDAEALWRLKRTAAVRSIILGLLGQH